MKMLHRSAILVFVLVACKSSMTGFKSFSSEQQALREKIEQTIGSKYAYGGTSPRSGFDCSGYAQYLYKEMNIELPRSSKEQSKYGNRVNMEDARIGDLIFFKLGRKVDHVATIYEIDGEKIIMAHSTTSRGVVLEDLKSSTYWMERLAFLKRIL